MAKQYKYPLNKNLSYLHEPLRGRRSAAWAVGRTERARALAERIMFLRGGAFLVTGFRGVGKTTFAHLVLEIIRAEKQRYARILEDFELLDVWINLARPIAPPQLMHHIIRHLYLRLKEMNLLKSLDSQLRNELETAFLRTTFEISSRSLITEERGHTESVGFEKSQWLGLQFLGQLSASYKRGRSEEEALKYLPYDERAAEFDILNFSGRLAAGISIRERWWNLLLRALKRSPASRRSLKVVFILDELDKLEKFGRDQNVGASLDLLLESLKTIFTASDFSFLFIAGKETQERLLRDVALGDSLYESIFGYDLYLPCLWEEQKELIHRCAASDKKISGHSNGRELALFQRYLFYKARGIPRRFFRELNTYVVWEEDSPVLLFDLEQRRYIQVFAKLQEALEQTPDLFGIKAQQFEHAHFDRQRLCLYYSLDWIFRRKGESFTAKQLQESARKLNLGPGTEWVSSEPVIEDIIRLLLNRAFIEVVRETVAQIDLKSEKAQDKYRLSNWVLLAFQPAPEKHWIPDEAAATSAPSFGTEFQMLGRYQVLEKIGEGGFGIVYRVVDRAGIVRAAKVLRREFLSTPKALHRFRQEIEIMAKLKHPNIVPFRDWGLEGESPYFVMDYVSGASLRTILQNLKKLPADYAVAMGKQLAEAFQYAHGQGVICGDIKPSNIILADNGTIKVIDFGIANLLSSPSTGTITGHIVGTVGYMSPEQARGKELDARSDIFSLGILIYEMLTGETPFQGDNVTAILLKLINEDALPPSRLVQISPRLETAIMRALAKQPESRFRSMEQFANALTDGTTRVDLLELLNESKIASKRISISREEDTVMESETLSPIPPLQSKPAVSAEGTHEDLAVSVSAKAADRLRHPDTNERVRAIEVLAKMGPQEATPELLGMLRDPEPKVRQAVLSALSNVNPPCVFDLLFDFEQRICFFTADEVSSTGLDKGRLTLGRSPTAADLVLNRPEVSRQHAAFFIKEETVEVEDLGSANGLQLNMAWSIRAQLANGDRLTIGPLAIRVHMFAPALASSTRSNT
ncbi:protein kinase [Acidobacteriia bacterium AH_259_A11_L15]|nr:protein kinase [Acidobacteriia bacterium AH_259_A11_L15]